MRTSPPSGDVVTDLARLTDEDIMALAGRATWGRGLTLQRSGKVEDVRVEGALVTARVRDQGLANKCVLTWSAGSLAATCACRGPSPCRHAIALTLTLRERARNAESAENTWRGTVMAIIGASRARGAPLALLVDAHDPSQPIWLTPLRPGSQGEWTTKRAGWTDLVATQWESVTDGVNPTHLAALREIYATAQRSGDALTPGQVSLEALGERAWPALLRLRRLGVRLLASLVPDTPFLLESASAEIALDLAEGEGAVTLTPRPLLAGEVPPVARIAARAGLLLLDGGTRAARLDDVADLAPLLSVGTLHVPAPEWAEFRSVHLPELQRRYRVISGDGSIDLDASGAARLVATVRLDGASSFAVRWWVEHDLAGRTSRIPLDHVTGDEAVADLRDRVEGRARALRLPADLWVSGPTGVRLPAWRAGEYLAGVVERLEDPGLVWDVSDDVRAVEVSGEGMSIDLSLRPREHTDWFDLDVHVRVGDVEIPLAGVLRALARGEEHLLVEGVWVRLDGERLEHLRELLDQARALDPSDGEGYRLGRWHLALWDEMSDLADTSDAPARWRGTLRALEERGSDLPVAGLPVGARVILRGYQEEGRRWLVALMASGLGGVLADDMGLGKTVQVLSALVSLPPEERAAPVLVVAPTSVVGTWVDEAQRWFPQLRVRAIIATTGKRGTPLAEEIDGADLVVTSYAIARLDAEEWALPSFSGLVIDEAQSVKNPRTASHAALRGIDASWRVVVTGTPIENSIVDLWAIHRLATPGLLPGWRPFNERIRRPIEDEGDGEVLARVRRLVAPFILRRTKEDVAPDLPDRVEQVVPVQLSEAHQRLYDRHLARERGRILGLLEDAERHRVEVLSSITRLRLLALDPALVDEEAQEVGSAKIDVLRSLLEEIVPRGHRVLVFSQFTSFLARIRAALEADGLEVLQLDGSTRDRRGVIGRFRSGEVPVFLVSLKAGGTGLTLTEADYVVLMDPWWNPSVEAQAVDRAHRIGQTRKVHVYRLVARGTVEEKVLDLQARKRALASSVLDGVGGAGRIDLADIRALIEG